MDFLEAIKFIPKGCTVTKSDWDNKFIEEYNRETNIAIINGSEYVITKDESIANNWLVRWG